MGSCIRLLENCGFKKTENAEYVFFSGGCNVQLRVRKGRLKTAGAFIKGKPVEMTETEMLACIELMKEMEAKK